MTTPWSHLPNAVHIDRILEDVRINSESWAAAKDASSDAAIDVLLWPAWNAAGNAAQNHARLKAFNSADEAVSCAALTAGHATWNAAWNAIVALIAWDEAGEYLNLSSDQVRVLSLLGDKKAILMLPAVMVFEQSTELV